jgi:hypothetical protein
MPVDPIKLRTDLIQVLDEHGVEYLSFSYTSSSARSHGQIQFEEKLKGDKQEKLPMSTEKA